MDEDKAPDRGEAIAKVEVAAEAMKVEVPPVVPAAAETEPAASNVEPPRIEIPPQPNEALAASSDVQAKRRLRIPPLAATIALAAGIGAIAGSIGTIGVARVLLDGNGEAALAVRDDNRVIKETIARINTDLAWLKSSFDTSTKTASTQFTRLVERLDRTEKAQAEPAARLARIAEAVERMNHAPASARPPAPAATDITGTIPEPRPSPLREASKAPIFPGWVLRSVFEGTALIQGRPGLIEVEVGDPLPGGGKVEAIRRQDGRWVVVTNRGLIVSAQR